MKEHKRQFRELEEETKQKISRSSKHRPKSNEHKKRIRQGMIKYWASVPHKENNTTNQK